MTFWNLREMISQLDDWPHEPLLQALAATNALVAACRVSRETTLEIWKDIVHDVDHHASFKLDVRLRTALGKSQVLRSLDALLK